MILVMHSKFAYMMSAGSRLFYLSLLPACSAYPLGRSISNYKLRSSFTQHTYLVIKLVLLILYIPPSLMNNMIFLAIKSIFVSLRDDADDRSTLEVSEVFLFGGYSQSFPFISRNPCFSSLCHLCGFWKSSLSIMCCSRLFLITSLLPVLGYALLCQLFRSSSQSPSLPLVSFCPAHVISSIQSL
ncbi:hypothetical protein BJX68DRAFT_45427 [Aspergillus pseudodeflectus]|uniref:Uncharacterized protein n=1 Tax=Aspergillus pseudodeflectus TaxID=176178 RepID=A0ABR4KNS4_9EURO